VVLAHDDRREHSDDADAPQDRLEHLGGGRTAARAVTVPKRLRSPSTAMAGPGELIVPRSRSIIEAVEQFEPSMIDLVEAGAAHP
jgi:hypothetical protein